MTHHRAFRLLLAAAIAASVCVGARASSPHHRAYGHGGHFTHRGLGHYSNVGHRLHEVRARLHYQVAHRPYGVWRHHGLGHGGYGYGVRSYHGLGAGYAYGCLPSAPAFSSTIRPYFVTPYPGGVPYVSTGWFTVGAAEYARSSETPVVEVVDLRADRTPPAPKPTRLERAWALLADGQARAALRDFSVLALRNVNDAVAKVGYGLAAATLGKDEAAVWAVRRALVTDGQAIGDLVLDERLIEPVDALRDHFAGSDHGDALFMTAALNLLLRDQDPALAAVTAALERGDDDRSTQALHALLAPAPEPRPEPSDLVSVAREPG